MTKNTNKVIFLLMSVLLIKVPTLAIDIKDYGDFSSRSLIMSEQKNPMTQAQRDELAARKIVPSTQCLITQIKKNNYDNVELLISTNMNLNASYLNDYPIYIAAKENRFEILKLLFENGAKLDRGFNSELCEAVKNKNEQMALFLIKNRANINFKDPITENTVLYYALKNNMLNVAKKLIDKGVKADRKSVLLIKNKKLYNLIEDKTQKPVIQDVPQDNQEGEIRLLPHIQSSHHNHNPQE